MRKIINILIITLLLSCTSNYNDRTETLDKSKSTFEIDTLLSDYKVSVKLNHARFRKGIDNDIILQISNIPNDNISIYTKTSEATVKLAKDKSAYMVHPSTKTESVTIHVNIKKEGIINLIGKLK